MDTTAAVALTVSGSRSVKTPDISSPFTARGEIGELTRFGVLDTPAGPVRDAHSSVDLRLPITLDVDFTFGHGGNLAGRQLRLTGAEVSSAHYQRPNRMRRRIEHHLLKMAYQPRGT